MILLDNFESFRLFIILCNKVPAIDDIQSAVNGGAVTILKCSKMIEAWDTVTIPKNVQLIINPNLPPVMSTGSQGILNYIPGDEQGTLDYIQNKRARFKMSHHNDSRTTR
jgi:hypothetical protein